MSAPITRTPALVAALAAALLVACEPPPVVPTQDRRQNTVTSRIEGELLMTGRARGDAVVFLFDAARPPPPTGTGRPLAFDVVSAEELFGAALANPDHAGPFTAPFVFSLVPPGNYLIKGFIDVNGDFNPWLSVTGEPNKGDVGGAAADLVTQKLVSIAVGAEAPTTGVTVAFSETSTTVPFDRPAFRSASTATFDPAGGLKVFELLPAPMTEAPVNQKQPVFLARYVDDDGNGVADDADKDGQPDLWPKVVVRKLDGAAPYLLDENDLDRNGVPDATGLPDYERADGQPGDGLPDVVVLAAGLVRDEPVAALTASGGAPAPLGRLQLAVRPIALDARNPAAPIPLKTVPSGRYAITVVQFTGQTWRLPNEQSPLVQGALGARPVDTQGFTLEVP